MQTTLAPARSEPRRAATSPWMWNSGMTLRHRSVGPSRRVEATFAAEINRLRSLSGTNFGEPVVPDVNSSSAASVSLRVSSGVTRQVTVPRGRTSPPFTRLEFDHGDPARRRRAAGRRLVAPEHHDGSRLERGELVRELAFRQVGRKRCAHGSGHRAEDRRRRFRSVRDGDGDPIGVRDPHGSQVSRDLVELPEQIVVRRRFPPRRQQRDAPRACGVWPPAAPPAIDG